MNPPSKETKTGVFIFHRDLRIHDNIGFSYTCSHCDKLYAVFIFDPEQITDKNKYRSKRAIQFMLESLEDLSKEIKNRNGELLLLYGNYNQQVLQLINKLDINIIIENRDYTPFARKREHSTTELCKKHNIEYVTTTCDYYLFEPGSVLTNNNTGKAYMKFTPFYLSLLKSVEHKKFSIPIKKTPTKIHWGNQKHLENKISIVDAMKKFVGHNVNSSKEEREIIRGGRTEGLRCLRLAKTHQTEYDEKRDIFTYRTTHLSAYIKFGCVSIREVYNVLSQQYGKKSGIVRELLWREFFAHVLYAYPEVIQHSYQEKYRHIKWNYNEGHFEKWKEGRTGFPIVDAGMREMNATGYMHNRARMIVANFLCKILYLDWRKGEQYFAQSLIDYDIASNNGNWQSISSTGVDGKPYYNTFNPFIQSAKYDKDANYIKKWIPELEPVLSKDIHNWENTYEKYKHITDYPKPMVDYKKQTELLSSYYHS